MVVWGHCSQFLFGEIYAFHMPLFFFLSGCVLSVDKPYKEIIKKKVKQLLLPYVFFYFTELLLLLDAIIAVASVYNKSLMEFGRFVPL